MNESHDESAELPPSSFTPAPLGEWPAPPPPEAAHWAAPNFKSRPTRPLLGPGLWLFGSALWAYVVAGQLVVAKDLPEPFAVVGVLFAFGVAWYFAIERSFASDPPSSHLRKARVLLPAALAFALWFGTVMLTAVIGLASGGPDGLFTVGLWLLAVVAYFLGRRMTYSEPLPPLEHARRALGVLLWLGAVVVTVTALVSVTG